MKLVQFCLRTKLASVEVFARFVEGAATEQPGLELAQCKPSPVLTILK